MLRILYKWLYSHLIISPSFTMSVRGEVTKQSKVFKISNNLHLLFLQIYRVETADLVNGFFL